MLERSLKIDPESNSDAQKETEEKNEAYLKEKASEYIRIGTKYYRILNIPQASGDIQHVEKPWTRQTIVEDHGKGILSFIKKYIEFCNVPSHLDYKPAINGYYNQYRSLNYKPEKGDCKKSLNFLKHIFGDQLEYGLDYLKLLYVRPTQTLPILCLVSKERGTGKSTFLKWLNAIFGLNMTINTNQDFESNFNSDWSRKLVIAIDETFIDKKIIAERIKYLSTTSSFKQESKGLDKIEIEFWGKFIFASNNEENFLPIEEEEIRYWVRKINPIKTEDPETLNLLRSEIPAFLHYILNRNFTCQKSSRMWFTKQQIYTDALQKAIEGSRTYFEKELKNLIREKLIEFLPDIIRENLYSPEKWFVAYKQSDIIDLMKNIHPRTGYTKLTEILDQKWNLKYKNSTYRKYYQSKAEGGDWFTNYTTEKGKFYKFFADKFLTDEEIKEAKSEINNEIKSDKPPF